MQRGFILSENGKILYGFGKGLSKDEIVIPEGVTHIEFNGIPECRLRYVNKLVFPKSLSAIYNSPFRDSEVKEIVFLGEESVAIGPYAFSGCSDLKKVTLPKKQKWLKDFVFSNCHSLEEVVNSDNIISIGKYTFNNCYELKGFNWRGVDNIGDGAFRGCKSLSLISFDLSSVTEIKPYTFAECNPDSDIRLPSTLKVIEPYAFAGCCLNIIRTTIDGHRGYCISNIPSELVIKSYAFAGARIKYMYFPSYGKIYVENYAFDACNDLEEVHLTQSVYCEEYAFSNIYSLMKVKWYLGCHNKAVEYLKLKNSYILSEFSRDVIQDKPYKALEKTAKREELEYRVYDHYRRSGASYWVSNKKLKRYTDYFVSKVKENIGKSFNVISGKIKR